MRCCHKLWNQQLTKLMELAIQALRIVYASCQITKTSSLQLPSYLWLGNTLTNSEFHSESTNPIVSHAVTIHKRTAALQPLEVNKILCWSFRALDFNPSPREVTLDILRCNCYIICCECSCIDVLEIKAPFSNHLFPWKKSVHKCLPSRSGEPVRVCVTISYTFRNELKIQNEGLGEQ